MNTPKKKRKFTGNFDALLKHDNQNPETRYAKSIAKKMLKAYLAGKEQFGMMTKNPKTGTYGMSYFPVPSAWV